MKPNGRMQKILNFLSICPWWLRAALAAGGVFFVYSLFTNFFLVLAVAAGVAGIEVATNPQLRHNMKNWWNNLLA